MRAEWFARQRRRRRRPTRGRRLHGRKLSQTKTFRPPPRKGGGGGGREGGGSLHAPERSSRHSKKSRDFFKMCHFFRIKAEQGRAHSTAAPPLLQHGKKQNRRTTHAARCKTASHAAKNALLPLFTHLTFAATAASLCSGVSAGAVFPSSPKPCIPQNQWPKRTIHAKGVHVIKPPSHVKDTRNTSTR